MGWRDRVKKSFADSAYIAEGIQNLKNLEKKEKEGLKTTFRHLTHNTQNTQNPQNRNDECGNPKPDRGDTPSTVKIRNPENKPDPAQNIPDPSPAGMGPEYNRIWNQAWSLADYIDNPEGAPIEDRRANLPELDRLRERMADIERQTVPTAGPEAEPSPPGTWHTWESTDTATRDRTPDTCPAKCNRTGKCYAAAYFEGKPGRAKECESETCKHMTSERGNHDSQTA